MHGNDPIARFLTVFSLETIAMVVCYGRHRAAEAQNGEGRNAGQQAM